MRKLPKRAAPILSCLLLYGASIAAACPVLAQEPPKPSPTSEHKLNSSDAAAIRAELAALNQRIKELEAKLDAQSEPPSNSNSVLPAAAPSASAAAAEDSAGFFKSVEITGMVDGYYEYNFLRPAANTQLRNFDTHHNQFSLNLLELALERKPTEKSRGGFRLDLNAGPATEMVHAAEPGGTATYKYIEQAYVSYLASVGSGLQFDFGKFVTPHGAEVIESRDNWNYSRSLLFALAIPYYHAGLRTSYSFNSRFSLAAFVVNGWNNVEDNNSGKTIGFSATFKPTKKLTWTQNYMSGPEQSDHSGHIRYLSDSLLSYQVHPRLSLLLNYDYGTDRVESASVHWQGIAAYARWDVNKALALTPRYEYYSDPSGFTSGMPQTLQEFTFTAERKLGAGFISRVEFRHDRSDHDFFQNSDGVLKRTQNTAGLGLVYSFSSREE